MTAAYATWRALPRHEQAFSILLALVPCGLVFGRAIAMAGIIALALSTLWRAARGTLRWEMLDSVSKFALVLGALLLFVATPLAQYDALRALKVSLGWLCFPLFYIAVVTRPHPSRAGVLPALGLTAVLLGVMLLDGTVQYATGTSLSGHTLEASNYRITGPLTHPNFTPTVTSFLCILLAWNVASLHTTHYGLKGAMLLTITVLCALSGDRSAMLLWLAALCAGAGLSAFSYPQRRAGILGLLGCMCLMLAAAYHSSPYLQERVAHFISQLANFPYSLYGQLYQAALFLWLDAPFTGIGVSNFRLACPALGAHYLFDCNLHPHNYLLEFLSEGGVFACLAWAGVIAAFAGQCERAYRAGGARRRVAIVGVMIAMLHLWPFIGTQSAFSTWRGSLLWYTLAMWAATRHVPAVSAKENHHAAG